MRAGTWFEGASTGHLHCRCRNDTQCWPASGNSGRRLERLQQGGLSVIKLSGAFEDPADVLQGHMPMAHRFGVEMFRRLGIMRPLFHCLADQPAVFKDTTEIDMAGSELRIGLQTGAECLYGARAVAEPG